MKLRDYSQDQAVYEREKSWNKIPYKEKKGISNKFLVQKQINLFYLKEFPKFLPTVTKCSTSGRVSPREEQVN